MSASRETPDAAVDAVFATVGEPIRYSSLFYALLYAADVAGVADAGFDFGRIRELSAGGFFWYGVATITEELAHLGDRYVIRGTKSSTLEATDPLVVEHIEKDLFPGDRSKQAVAKHLWRVVPPLWQIEDPVEMEQVFRTLDEEFDVMQQPEQYIRNVRRMFDATPSIGKGFQAATRDDDTGWPVGYNGPSWVAVCDHLLRRDGLGETAFVDQSWAIEHNNNRWIDKIFLIKDRQQLAAMTDVTGLDLDSLGEVRAGDILRATNDVLDAARDGDIGRLFDYAVLFNMDVDVDLRRLRLRLGV